MLSQLNSKDGSTHVPESWENYVTSLLIRDFWQAF